MERGSYEFEAGDSGGLLNTASNVELLRELWLDREKISGDNLGPGDPGDFDHGAWHVACHLAGACGVQRRPDGSLAWLQISHDGRDDLYFASITVLEGANTRTVPLDSAEGRMLQVGNRVVGFVEGTSKAGSPPATSRIRRRCSTCGAGRILTCRRAARRTAGGCGSIGAPCATYGRNTDRHLRA